MNNLVPADKLMNAVADIAGDEYRAFKFNPELNCVFMQKGLSVLVLPAFEQEDGTVFINKDLGFKALRQGCKKMELLRQAFVS